MLNLADGTFYKTILCGCLSFGFRNEMLFLDLEGIRDHLISDLVVSLGK
jgi:hypothetical protein